MRKFDLKSLQKSIKMTGEQAMIEAKINNTYIVFKNDKGIFRKYPDGKIVPDSKED